MAAAQAGDAEAFGVLYEHFRAPLFNYVYRIMGDADDAANMSQDAWVHAWLHIRQTNTDLHTRVQGWLYRIATNVCLDELRHRKLVHWDTWDAFISVYHPSQQAKDDPVRDVLTHEDQDEIAALMDRMHPQYRMLLILRHYHDLSYGEMADTLHTTRAAIKSSLLRARCEFRALFARTEAQPGGSEFAGLATGPRRTPHVDRAAVRAAVRAAHLHDDPARVAHCSWCGAELGTALNAYAPVRFCGDRECQNVGRRWRRDGLVLEGYPSMAEVRAARQVRAQPC